MFCHKVKFTYHSEVRIEKNAILICVLGRNINNFFYTYILTKYEILFDSDS